MSHTYISSSLLDSTIWREAYPTKIAWITLLLMADQDGKVEASIPGLAHRAGITIEEADIAIDLLQSPDFYSRNNKNKGRRIEETENGWIILNYEEYKKMQPRSQ